MRERTRRTLRENLSTTEDTEDTEVSHQIIQGRPQHCLVPSYLALKRAYLETATRSWESSRRKGAGSAMLRHIIATARAFYSRHGFVECAPFAEYVLDPNSIFMSIDLAAT